MKKNLDYYKSHWLNSNWQKLLLKMKITIFLYFIGLVSLIAGPAYSQSTKISLDMKDASVESVLNKIEEISEFYFLFNHKLIDVKRKVDIQAEEEPIKNILSEIFPSDVRFIVSDRQIVLTSNQVSSTLGKLMLQQTITGKVIDASTGEVMAGVNIQIKGTTLGTITDTQGNFTLSIPEKNAILIFSFIGYITQEISLTGNMTVNVALAEELTSLEEVVVIGYSTQRKKDIIGSVVIADVAGMKTNVATSAQNALQGMASGVNVINSGIPGAAAKIVVRGITSFGNTNPLVIIDGIPASLNQISATEIESIQVLKDAGSSAIYGVRGANGVIIVTTKKGKIGAPVLSYEGSYGITYPLRGNPYNMLSSEEWFGIFKQLYPGSELCRPEFGGKLPDYVFRGPFGAGAAKEGDPRIDPSLYHYDLKNTGSNYIIQKVNKTNDGGDWWDWTFNPAPTIMQNMSISGGTEKAKYHVGIGYIDQKGTMVESFMKRYTARANTEFNLNKYLTFGENLSYMHQKNPSVGDDYVMAAWRMTPIVPLYDIMGNWGGSFGGPDLGVNANQIALADRNLKDDHNFDWVMRGNAFADLKFLKVFTARTSIGFTIDNYYDHNFTANQPENVERSSIDNSLNVSSSYSSSMIFTNTLNYFKTLSKHDIKVLVGSEAIKSVSRSVSGNSGRFYSVDPNYQVLGNGTINIATSSSVGVSALFSVFSRIDYTFDDKYLFGATLRRDGSSVFGSKKRYGVFPSVSIGWRVTNENFMQNVSWLNDLKIRGSYGILGSQNNVSSSNAFSLYGSGLGTTYYDITGSSTSTVQGFARSRIGNPFAGWEENIVFNFGFDATILNNSLELSLEYYKKSIKGLLFPESLPAVIIGGATAPTINIGDVQNKGVDGTIKYHNKISSNLNYSIALNVTTYKNEVVDIPSPGYFYSGSMQVLGSICRNEEGHPASSFYGYQIVGIFQDDEDLANSPPQDGSAVGRWKYQDVNKDGAITPDDRVHLGDPHPDFTYGINLNLEYKGFDFSSNFYGTQGNELMNGVYNYTAFFSNYSEAKSKRLLNAWTPENRNTNEPKLEIVKTLSTANTMNSYYVEDGSYFRWRSAMLGYTIKPVVLQKIGISRLRVYVQASNLFTITNYSGVDPEIGGSSSAFGIDTGKYPNNEKSLVFGLNVTF